MNSQPQQSSDVRALILAAGRGVRMKSELPKVLMPLAEKPMVEHVVDNLVAAGVKSIVVVVGYKKELVIEALSGRTDVEIKFAEQLEQKGTAHAVNSARSLLAGESGDLLVTNGDMPLIRPSTLKNLLNYHRENGNRATVLSASIENPTGYGRLVRDDSGQLLNIVEEKDASPEIKTINEINSGTFIFTLPEIFEILESVDSNNAQQEFYLPDVISILRSQGQPVGSYICENSSEALGANSREDLELLETKLKAMAG